MLQVKNKDGGTVLVYEVISTKNQYLFDVILMQLHSNEVLFKEGRFSNYTTSNCMNSIHLEINHVINLSFVNIIEWIATHCIDTLWSFNVSMQSVNTGYIDFNFDSDTIAILFALVWK